MFAEMLSLPNDGRYPTLELTPQQRRQKTLEALHAQVETLARKSPVLMIFEDAHWSDPTSLEVFGRAVDRIANLPVLLLITFRPEFEPPWIGQPHVTALTLNRLTRREIEAMIDRVAGNKPMPANIRQEIIERTDGIPLFVEEMTKAVLEAGSQGPGEHDCGHSVRSRCCPGDLARLADGAARPAWSCQRSRADRSGDRARVLSCVARCRSPKIRRGNSNRPWIVSLWQVCCSGRAFPPHANYLFKHALVQDAAYGTLLRDPRRALHARIAEVLETQFVEIAENQPELLARHCTEAELIEKAANLWGKAGQRSLERSALVEAIEQLTRALNQIATLPTTAALRREQIKLQVALIAPLIHVKGYSASETKAAAERARALIETSRSAWRTTRRPNAVILGPLGLLGR